MNIIIYTVVILTIFYFLLRLITNISSRKISKGLRFFIILGLFALAVLFAIGGKFLLTLPLTLASLALLKLKGFQAIKGLDSDFKKFQSTTKVTKVNLDKFIKNKLPQELVHLRFGQLTASQMRNSKGIHYLMQDKLGFAGF